MRNSESSFSQSLSHDGVKCVTISHTLDNLQCFLQGLLRTFCVLDGTVFKDFSWILPDYHNRTDSFHQGTKLDIYIGLFGHTDKCFMNIYEPTAEFV